MKNGAVLLTLATGLKQTLPNEQKAFIFVLQSTSLNHEFGISLDWLYLKLEIFVYNILIWLE